MLRLLLAAALLALPLAGQARAEMPSGADDPAYRAAVDLWLADDDRAALPELSRLARGGNTAAQVLLGRIASDDAYVSAWVTAMDSRERRRLFRAPTGGVGTRWLEIAAETSPLAQAFLDMWSDDRDETLATLDRLGEDRAFLIVLTSERRGDPDETFVDRVLRHGDDPSVPRWIVWMLAAEADGDQAARFRREPARAIADGTREGRFFQLFRQALDPTLGDEAAAALATYPYMGGPVPQTDALPDLTAAAMNLPETRQVSLSCERLCPDQPRACFEIAFGHLGGAIGMRWLGSPVETLIPRDRYLASPRAVSSLLRRVADSPYGFIGETGDDPALAAHSACLAEHVADIASTDREQP